MLMRKIEPKPDKIRVTCLAVGLPGSGKTFFSATFPKAYAAITGAGEDDTWAYNPELRKNIIGKTDLIADSPNDTKRLIGSYEEIFADWTKAKGELWQVFAEAKELAKTGQIDTFIFDNISYTARDVWTWINVFHPVKTRDGALDTRGMYGMLGTLLNVLVKGILAIPCNIVVTCHEQMESDEGLAKKVDKGAIVVPAIPGGIRNIIEGMFSNVLYLSRREDSKNKDVPIYVARTVKGEQRNAKNRYNLPPFLVNPSYGRLVEEIKKRIEVK